MPPRDCELDWLLDWLDRFAIFYQREEPQFMWTTTNGCRAQRTYIDEMADQLGEEIAWRVYEELVKSVEPEPTTVAKVEVEIEDVDPEEFEKILNGD